MIAFILDTNTSFLVMIAVVFILLVVVGFLPARAISVGSRADGGSSSDCI
jgi:hypothetical protein